MGDILKKITEILSEGNNYTERRDIVLPNYFDCLEDDRPGTSNSPGADSTDRENDINREP